MAERDRHEAEEADGVAGVPPAEAEAPGATPKLSLREWRAAKKRVAGVLERLEAAGFVALAGVGSTQAEGFDECAEALRERGTRLADLVGFCYYTRQDGPQARDTGWLLLAFWGAPDGSSARMVRAGETVVTAFREAGFRVEWDGTEGSRPVVALAP